MIYSSSSYGNLGKILNQLCVYSALNFSTPISHSSASVLNFMLKKLYFQHCALQSGASLWLYVGSRTASTGCYEPIWSTAAGREDRRGSFQRDYFVLRGFLRLRGDLSNGFGKLASPFRLLDDQSLSSSNTPSTSPLLFDMVKQKPSVSLLIWFQCTHLLGVIFILYNEWTNRDREVHDWTKVIRSQDRNPILSPSSALFPGNLLGSEKRSLV